MNLFRHEFINDHLIRIIGFDQTACYLVNGSDSSLLIDTGAGYGSLKNYITDNHLAAHHEYPVVITHGHYDHAGSISEFNEVWMNPIEKPVLEHFFLPSVREAYLKEAAQMNHSILNPDLVLEMKNDHLLPLHEDQIFDLGNLHIRMIPASGHTPGIVCPLIEEDKIIIFGDACGVSVLLWDEFASSVSEYKKSLEHLKEFENQYDTILRCHGSYTSQKDLLDNVIECADKILNHTDARVPVTMHQVDLFSACEISVYGRSDGKEGNILYLESKVC